MNLSLPKRLFALGALLLVALVYFTPATPEANAMVPPECKLSCFTYFDGGQQCIIQSAPWLPGEEGYPSECENVFVNPPVSCSTLSPDWQQRC